ncbi:MAG: Nucleotidyltransferase domain protein [Methanobacterium sp. PtaU1.Bin097]|jgi:predicted nucleotidyltransferase|nr:MAG: Nucleotidyltransferase domain protein [Methanobacterium sp. PtaU1.Bin097]
MIDSEKVQAILSKLQVKMEEDPDILAVILYGSYARGEEARDVDLCLVLFPDKARKGLDKRIEYSYYDMIDVQVFQDLPLYMRPRIIKEGKLLHVKDEDLLYDVAIETAKEYELYRPKYEMYLDSIAK